MTGQFADGLTVGVIPMELVERVPLADRGKVLVSHIAERRRRWVPEDARAGRSVMKDGRPAREAGAGERFLFRNALRRICS